MSKKQEKSLKIPLFYPVSSYHKTHGFSTCNKNAFRSDEKPHHFFTITYYFAPNPPDGIGEEVISKTPARQRGSLGRGSRDSRRKDGSHPIDTKNAGAGHRSEVECGQRCAFSLCFCVFEVRLRAPADQQKSTARVPFFVGRGSWIRTSECRSQSPVPYRLAIPLWIRLKVTFGTERIIPYFPGDVKT